MNPHSNSQDFHGSFSLINVHVKINYLWQEFSNLASDWLAGCCQPIRRHVWKSLLNNMDFNMDINCPSNTVCWSILVFKKITDIYNNYLGNTWSKRKLCQQYCLTQRWMISSNLPSTSPLEWISTSAYIVIWCWYTKQGLSATHQAPFNIKINTVIYSYNMVQYKKRGIYQWMVYSKRDSKLETIFSSSSCHYDARLSTD